MARKRQGGAIVETAAAMTLLLPLVMSLMFVVVEVAYAYLIKSSLAQGARQAARSLAIAYGMNPQVATSRSMQNTMAYDNVRIANMINNSAQFDDAVFNTATVPHTVYVMVHYTSGQYGLPTFPFPDPLDLSSKFAILADSTYRLE